LEDEKRNLERAWRNIGKVVKQVKNLVLMLPTLPIIEERKGQRRRTEKKERQEKFVRRRNEVHGCDS
jgi:hypothetical protein